MRQEKRGLKLLESMGRPAGSSRVAWAVLLFALLAGGLLALGLAVLRDEALRAGEERTEALTHVIEEQTSRTLQSVDARLQLAIAQLQGLQARGALDEVSARDVLQGPLSGLPFLRETWVLDPEGRVRFDSRAGNIGRVLSDREYFRIYLREPATELFIGPPVRSRSTGHWQLTVSRPLRAADGSIDGIVVAALEPAHFEQLWRRIDLGANGVVALYSRSGQLLMRSPADETLLGRDFSRLPLFREVAKAPSGRLVRNSVVDGVQRIYAYRTLSTKPQLVVVVGADYAQMLASWRRFAWLTAVFWAGAVLIAAGLTLQLRRQDRIRAHSERRWRELAQAMPQIVFIADREGAVQFVNQRWTDATGLPVQQAEGAGWLRHAHPDDRAPTLAASARAVANPREVQHEVRLRYRDGSYRWQLLRAVPVRDDQGRVTAWYGTATEVDALKQAQARLLQQAEFLRMAGRLARLGGWRVDLATQRVTWSEEAAGILDLPPGSQPLVQEVMAMFAPESLQRSQRLLRECLEQGAPFDVEVEMVTAAGRRVWVRSLGQPVHDEEGRIVAMQGAQQDITARVRLVEEIRELNASLEEKVAQRTSELAQQEALFRTLAEQAPLPFWTVDPRGAPTFFSRAWYELVGGAPPQWLGGEWKELVHPDDLPEMLENWRVSRRTGAVYAGTRRLRARDGTYHSTVYRAEPVRDAAGRPVFWVGIDTDITDILNSQSALRLANEQLEAFAYSVSHDLQSPLQRVQSFARLLQEELAQAPAGRAQHYLARIRSNAETMTQLIEGLLALAQVSEMDIIRTTVNLSDMATDILQRLQQDQPQRRVQWEVQPGLAVHGDARLMRSVMENLIGNAWKFTARKEEARIVVGGSAERGEYFVHDNGAGFDMAYVDRLFGTFQRLHAADEFPGTGIGLATVARAISRQGGRIWAQAEPGQGATFFFTLPAA